MIENCGNCQFFKIEYSGTGVCRRYPPDFRPNDSRARFPRVRQDDWCGEWRLADEHRTPPPDVFHDTDPNRYFDPEPNVSKNMVSRAVIGVLVITFFTALIFADFVL